MGNRLPPVPVQMRGLRFNGTINEGDRVEIDQRWRRGEMLCPSRVRDLTTGVTVRSVVGPGYRFGVVFGWLIFLLIIAALLGLLVRLVWG
jgi:hypothetical protein